MHKTFMEATKKAKPRRVDFGLYQDDFECALLGALGRSTRFIQSKTGMTNGKISYRLRKASIKLSDYRNGDSTIARMVYRNMRPVLARELHQHLKKL